MARLPALRPIFGDPGWARASAHPATEGADVILESYFCGIDPPESTLLWRQSLDLQELTMRSSGPIFGASLDTLWTAPIVRFDK